MIEINLDRYNKCDAHYDTQLLQPIDIIKARGHLEPFALSCILKYAYRLPFKGQAKSDLLKIISYCRHLGVVATYVDLEYFHLTHEAFLKDVLRTNNAERIARYAICLLENIEHVTWLPQ